MLIGALGFADGLGCALYIENIVLDLEGETNAPRIAVEALFEIIVGLGAGQIAEFDAGTDQGACFIHMHRFELCQG